MFRVELKGIGQGFVVKMCHFGFSIKVQYSNCIVLVFKTKGYELALGAKRRKTKVTLRIGQNLFRFEQVPYLNPSPKFIAGNHQEVCVRTQYQMPKRRHE